jgi:nitroreductase
MKIEDITNLIETRRSHFAKEFNGNLAPKTLIENLINNANWAPSHKLTMPWHFVVFEDNSIKNLTNKILEIQISKNPELAADKISKIINEN